MLQPQNTLKLNEYNEREIDLKDLFFHVLYRWRSIIIIALVGALLACAWQFFSIARVHMAGELTKEEKKYEIDQKNYEITLAALEDSVESYQKVIENQTAYLNNSLLLKLDPKDSLSAVKKYSVTADRSLIEALPDGCRYIE